MVETVYHKTIGIMEKDKCDFCGCFTYCSRIRNSDEVICASCVFPKDLFLEVSLTQQNNLKVMKN